MPTYEFRCPAGHDFEKFYRKISDAQPEVTCPQCGAVAERRLSAGAGLLFKGSGFYITDYGKDGKGARKEPAAGGETTGGESKAGEAKPTSAGGESGGGSKAEGSATKGGESKSSGGSGGASGGSSGGTGGGIVGGSGGGTG